MLSQFQCRVVAIRFGNSPEWAAGRSGRRIIQVAVNLISNAAKFSPCGNTMRVRLADGHFPDGGEALRCSVSDNGRGIPENELEAVSGLFVQSSEAIPLRAAQASDPPLAARSWKPMAGEFGRRTKSLADVPSASRFQEEGPRKQASLRRERGASGTPAHARRARPRARRLPAAEARGDSETRCCPCRGGGGCCL